MHRKYFLMLLLILPGVLSYVYAQEQIGYKQIDTTQLRMEFEEDHRRFIIDNANGDIQFGTTKIVPFSNRQINDTK